MDSLVLHYYHLIPKLTMQILAQRPAQTYYPTLFGKYTTP